jgi:hypothetical protein
VLCYDPTEPFVPLPESCLHNKVRDFGHTQEVGFEAFQRTGLLKHSLHEAIIKAGLVAENVPKIERIDDSICAGNFALYPEAYIYDSVYKQLNRIWANARNNKIYKKIKEKVEDYISAGWIIVSKCQQLADNPVTNMQFQVNFVDNIQLKWYQFWAFETFADAAKYCMEMDKEAGEHVTILYKELSSHNWQDFAALSDMPIRTFEFNGYTKRIILNRLYQSAMYHLIIDKELGLGEGENIDVWDVLIIPQSDENTLNDFGRNFERV